MFRNHYYYEMVAISLDLVKLTYRCCIQIVTIHLNSIHVFTPSTGWSTYRSILGKNIYNSHLDWTEAVTTHMGIGTVNFGPHLTIF